MACEDQTKRKVTSMSDDAIQFDVCPKVVPADAETTITVRPAGGAPPFGPADKYEVTYFPTEEFAQASGWPEKNKPAFRIEDGAMKITQFFEAEQEHVLLIEAVAGRRRRRRRRDSERRLATSACTRWQPTSTPAGR